MKNALIHRTIGLLLALQSAAALAVGQGPYLGIGGGLANLNPGAPDAFEVDDSGFGIKGFGGFRLNSYLALEGHVGYQTGYGVESLGEKFDLDITTVGGAVLLGFPIGPGSRAFGKLGLAHWNSRLSFADNGFNVAVSNDGTNPYFGAGIEVSSFRFEWERFEYNSGADSDVFWVNYILSF